MNQELIDMAREAGFFIKDNEAYSPSVQEDHELTPFLETFAALVAAAEREACAEICESRAEDPKVSNHRRSDAEILAIKIRFRGETK